MNKKFISISVKAVLLGLSLTLLSGCVYYNTMYHARRWFNEAESSREAQNRDLAGGRETKLYSDAIIKCSSVLSDHPTSSWVDDALFIIGKSFYHLGENAKAERKFRELLSSFPKSKYVTESRFYLGKARFKLENYDDARESFSDFMKKTAKKKYRSEATYYMGEIAAAEGDTAEAVEYFNTYLKNFEGSPRTHDVQYELGQMQFELKNYAEAAKAYGAASTTTDDPKERYNALYAQGRAEYGMDSVDAGLAIYRQLESEQQDSVKLGEILLREAEGLQLSGAQRDAILLYDNVGTDFKNRPEACEAWYRIGALVQDDWSDLELAKEYFDKAAKVQRGSDFKSKAIERAAEITKVETFRQLLNSESKDEASQSRFMLAELYRTKLNSPDSALSEYEGLVKTFPESQYAPKALLNIGFLYETHFDDTTTANEYYEKVLQDYPKSDEVGAAVKLLGDKAVPPEGLYPGKLYDMAESQQFDEKNLDSAQVLYRLFLKDFPESELVPKADFAIAKIKLAQFIPADPPPTENPYRTEDSLLAIEAARKDSLLNSADSLAAQGADSLAQASRLVGSSKSESDSSVTMVFKGDSTLVDTSGAMSGDIRLIDLIGSPQDNKTPGGEKDSLPDKAKRNEFLHPELGSDSVPKRAGGPPADSLAPDSIRNKALPEPQSQQAKEHLQDSLRLQPGNNKTANAQDTASHSGPIKLHNALTDTTSGQVTDSLGHPVAPRDNKRISLKNFPLPHGDTLQNSSADSLAQPKDTLNAGVPVFARDSLGNPIELSDSLAGGSMASDSTQVDSTEVVVVDSSMIWLFQHLAQKYQGTDIGTEAERLAKGETVARKAPKLKQPGRPELVAAQAAPDTTQAAADTTTSPFAIQDTTLQAQAIEDSLKAEIDRWPLMQYEPITAPEFEYPIEAATSKFQGRVVTEIKIDFDGRVTDVKILKGSNVPLIDQEVKNTLLETYFDPMKIDPLHLGSYFIYNYEITLPEVYK